MKKLAIASILMVLLLPFLAACSSNSAQTSATTPFTSSPTPTGPQPHLTVPTHDMPTPTVESPDDIVITPGGVAYRANVHQQGTPDKWPSIEYGQAALAVGSENLTVTYRAPFETKAGTSRNDIIDVYKTGAQLLNNKLEFYSVGAPDGIGLYIGSGGGLPGEIRTVVVVDVGSGVASGKYTFYIGIVLDGQDYGTVPCTVTVTK